MITSKILHIAPFNIAGVPITLVKAERELGYYSRLITFGKHPNNYDEDICLNLPLLNFKGLRIIKRFLTKNSRHDVTNIEKKPDKIPLEWRVSRLEKILFKTRETLWKKRIEHTLKKYEIEQFDIIQLDSGLEFYRDGRIIRSLKNKGKKIICCYLGSDLRIRGVIPEIDIISDVNITDEFDHLQLHPNIHHIFFPFNWKKITPRKATASHRLKIGHAPTNRKAKGSDIIIPIVKSLEKELPVDLLLIENQTYQQALLLKSQCDIFIDQIGDLGYGINSLESLAMEIPTCSCLAPGFAEQYPDHPFVVINEINLKDRLIELIKDKNERQERGRYGREWVKKYHDVHKIVKRIHTLLGE